MTRPAMMYVGLAVVAVALAALLLNGEGGSIAGMDSDRFANLAYLGAVLVLVVAGFWRTFQHRLGASLRALAIWAAIGLALVVGYTYREQAQELGGSVLGALRPGTAVVGPGGVVTITRRSDGDFSVLAQVNGRTEQRFTFDTGASAVVLTAESAAALGITPGEGDYTARVSTANGTTRAAPIRLDSIAIGPITERGVDAWVSQPGALSVNLLGQSFLTRLPSYEVRGDRLILRSR